MEVTEETKKSEILFGGPYTDEDVWERLNFIRLWAEEQIPCQGWPWMSEHHMDLARAAAFFLPELASRPNLQED